MLFLKEPSHANVVLPGWGSQTGDLGIDTLTKQYPQNAQALDRKLIST